MGLTQQASLVMNPPKPKSEDELAGHIDNWLNRIQELEKHGSEYKVCVAFRRAALSNMLIGRARDMLDQWEEQVTGGGELRSELQWDQLIKKVMDYAARRRLETQSHSHMDIGAVSDQWQNCH